MPYKERSINTISVAVDAPENQINELTNKIGSIDGVSSNAEKTVKISAGAES